MPAPFLVNPALLALGYSGGRFDFPDGFRFESDDFDTKVEKFNLSFADGAKSFGEEIKDRRASLQGTLICDSRAEFRQHSDHLRFVATLQGSKLYHEAGYYLNLSRLESYDLKFEKGFGREVSEDRIVWQCDDPFWYSDTVRTESFNVAGTQDFSLDPTIGGWPKLGRGQFPVITITAPGPSPGPIRLTNLSDGGLNFTFSLNGLRDGASVVIDCLNGLVTMGGNSVVRYFGGEFLRLLSQPNSLRYHGNGNSVSVQFQWRPRWL